MACICGHSEEEHGHDPKFPGSVACTQCDCIHFEEDDHDYFESANVEYDHGEE